MNPEEAVSLWEAARRHNTNPTPETAKAFQKALEAVEGDINEMLVKSFALEPTAAKVMPIKQPQPSSRPTKRRAAWGLMAAGVLALLVIAVAAAALVFRQSTSESPIPTLAQEPANSSAVAANLSPEPTTDLSGQGRPTLPPTFTPTPTLPLPTTSAIIPPTQAAQAVEPTAAPLASGLAILPACTPDHIARASAGVATNGEWTPCSQVIDGVEMVLVPKGEFLLGSLDPGIEKSKETLIRFDQPFWIDRYEVTNAQFDALDGGAELTGKWIEPQRPRENITWFEAGDFCTTKRGMRLPTEAEWEYAARGPDNLIYPWGNNWNDNYAVWSQNSEEQTAVVGSRPEGKSWVGSLDMIGNVWEWVSSLGTEYPYVANDGRENMTNTSGNRVIRGGAYYNGIDQLRASSRPSGNPDAPDEYKGFRCVRDFN